MRVISCIGANDERAHELKKASYAVLNKLIRMDPRELISVGVRYSQFRELNPIYTDSELSINIIMLQCTYYL